MLIPAGHRDGGPARLELGAEARLDRHVSNVIAAVAVATLRALLATDSALQSSDVARLPLDDPYAHPRCRRQYPTSDPIATLPKHAPHAPGLR